MRAGIFEKGFVLVSVAEPVVTAARTTVTVNKRNVVVPVANDHAPPVGSAGQKLTLARSRDNST